MARANLTILEDDRRFVMRSYLEEMKRGGEVAKVRFAVTRACSCCGETGYVPEHHKFLCVFCWVAAPFLAGESYQAFGTSEHATRESEGRGVDKVNSNIPIGIQGVETVPQDSDITIYSSKYFSQEELQAMIP